MSSYYTDLGNGKVALNIYIYDAPPSALLPSDGVLSATPPAALPPPIAPAALVASPPATPAPEWLELRIVTTSPNQTYSFEIASGAGIALQASWGDGSALENIATAGRKIHNYPSAGTYTLKIKGKFNGGGGWLKFGKQTDSSALKQILTPIPDLGLTSFASTFSGCLELAGAIPSALFQFNPLATSFQEVFSSCPNLVGPIPPDLFSLNPLVTSFQGAFLGCRELTGSIPSSLFSFNGVATTFRHLFLNCFSLTGAIPADLFKFNGQATDFYGLFGNCSGLTGTIPSDLFAYNSLATTFNSTFYNCTGITGPIPAGLFRFNRQAVDFASTFLGCEGLTGLIPSSLFHFSLLATTFQQTFMRCPQLSGAIPSGLFLYNTQATLFNSSFKGCSKLQITESIFYLEGGTQTRFLGKVMDFTSAFEGCGTETTGGTAPALWDCLLDVAAATACFRGSTAATLSNFDDVPVAWI